MTHSFSKPAGRVGELIERGVIILCPESVELGEEVRPERIAPGVVLHRGSRVTGAQTSLAPGCEIGTEAPATIENCQLGKGVSLKGGYFSGATFLDGVSLGSGAHVRAGTLLEEEACGAHAVGFKQTILFPFVVTGSLINFCDCLMAGGTGRRNHSEVGSSYIHFNFTPHQDKATASLIGDVPRGVMLDHSPIFLGGQGGLVGPVRVAYGTIIPAGIICRQDILQEDQLFGASPPAIREPRKYVQGMYGSLNRLLANNLIYIGNIQALLLWYRLVRGRIMAGDPFAEACWTGGIEKLEMVLDERIRRLQDLAGKMPRSLELAREMHRGDLPPHPYAQQQALLDRWPEMENRLRGGPDAELAALSRDTFLEEWEQVDKGKPYPEAIASISREGRAAGVSWLQAIVDATASLWKSS